MDLATRVKEAALELHNDENEAFQLEDGMLELIEKIYSDQHTHQPQLENAYLFANTADNQDSIFTAAKELQDSYRANKFLIIDGIEANGFPGYEKWSQSLASLVGMENIGSVTIAKRDGVNTYSEAQALLAYTRQNSIDAAYVVASPFHQLRAYMTAASEAIKDGSKLNIVGYTKDQPEEWWNQEAIHSQGILTATRKELIKEELKRIQLYDNILSPKEVLSYMHNRKIPLAPITQ